MSVRFSGVLLCESRAIAAVRLECQDVAPVVPTNSVSQAKSRLLYLQGAAAMASLRLEQAKQRQGAATDAVKYAEADLKAARKALNEAEKAGRH